MVQRTERPRARELGISFDGTPGPSNAITDVRGVEVGHVTVVPGSSVPAERRHWVRTGVTVVLPRGRADSAPVWASLFVLNGNGELTGAAWVATSGWLDGPLLLTNTDTVGLVRDSAVRWARDHGLPTERWSLPVVGETWDGYLNDVAGRHLREEHVRSALESASSGPVEEGSVGSGTSAICYGFKGGIGSSSRRIDPKGRFHLGVLVQANHGRREQLRIAGVPVGRLLGPEEARRREEGSIVGWIATDAPLLPHQLQRVARRAALGLARSGSVSGNGSGDFFLAFSTAEPELRGDPADGILRVPMLPDERLDPVFEAAVTATDEAIVNCLVAGETTVGYEEHRVEGLPIDRVLSLLERAGALGRPGA